MKASMPNIIGNQKLRDRLCHDVMSRTMSHAYILSGPRGSGKHTVARQFAAAVACERKEDANTPLPCCECLSCRKILEGKSPDVITIAKDGHSVKVEQIRTLQTDVRTFPNDLDDKFYIIEDADTMTTQAQNAFLLTLEEPPSFVHFFLLCKSEEPLLETVRSRAPVLRTEPITKEDIRTHLLRTSAEARGLSADDLDELLTIADGSIGRAIELLDESEREPFTKRRRQAQLLVESALAKRHAALIELINTLPQKQDELFPILSAVQVALRDLIALKQSETAPLCFYTDRETATELAYRYSLAAMIRLYDNLADTEERLGRNANMKLTLTAMIAKL